MPKPHARILLTGAGGQLGRDLAIALSAVGDVVACDRARLDVGDASAIARAVRETCPDAIVNAAAYTAVDRAESDRDRAFAVNAQAPGVIAAEAKRAGAVLIHYSTDYVFDGARATPYDEAAEPHPLNVYGASKLAGERAVAASGACAIVLRTSWVYARHGQNFLVTMQKIAARQREVRVVADQTGVPNWTGALAFATRRLLAHGLSWLGDRAGLYHLSAHGQATWYDFAREILREDAGMRVTPIATADYPTPAARPCYGVLDATRFAEVFGFALPGWQTLLQQCLRGDPEPPPRPQVG